ncbi:MAG: hypothetical protein H6713_19885 [Myxococcales bacterium]|nr:hypothetical protein [Myxococcales bacterium]MCB9752222.1 hypothetical protein [Myxococcales bacterium]
MPSFLRHIDRDQPVCKHLRTKALYVYGQDTPDAFSTSRSSGYQCLRTQFVTGPDSAPCVPEDCTRARACFEAR